MNSHTTQTVLSLPAFAHRLMLLGAFKVTDEGYTIKSHEAEPSARPSPYYVNLRIPENKDGTLTYGEVTSVAGFFYEYLTKHQIKFDGIVGLPRAGEPFARALQDLLYHGHGHPSYPLLTMQKEEGPDGRKIGKVLRERELPRGSRVLVLDDLISRSHTKKEAVEELVRAGYTVTDVLVFLDREQAGGKELRSMGVRLHSVITISALLRIYEEDQSLTPAEVSSIRQYVASFT